MGGEDKACYHRGHLRVQRNLAPGELPTVLAQDMKVFLVAAIACLVKTDLEWGEGCSISSKVYTFSNAPRRYKPFTHTYTQAHKLIWMQGLY